MSFLGLLAAAEPDDPRLPLHPRSLVDLAADVRRRVWVEQGVGQPYGMTDARLRDEGLQVGSRTDIVAMADVLVSTDASSDLVRLMRAGQSLLGWVDPSYRSELAEIAQAQGATVVDADAMNHWAADGSFVGRVFHLNTELAGYAAVMHALTSRGVTGSLGQHLTAVVIGLGHAAKGAIAALQGLGVLDITVLTLSSGSTMRKFPGLEAQQMFRRDDNPSRALVTVERGDICVAEFMGAFDIVVNCVTHDPDAPLQFADDEEIGYLPTDRLIVDVAPLEGIGFPCAARRPYDDPSVTIGNGVTYHAGNDSQRLFWNTATWAASQTLTPYLPFLLGDRAAWLVDPMFARAKVSHA